MQQVYLFKKKTIEFNKKTKYLLYLYVKKICSFQQKITILYIYSYKYIFKVK